MRTTKKGPPLLFMLNRTCLQKPGRSLREADDLVTKAYDRGLILYYYKCKICSRYHMTSKEPREYEGERAFTVI